MFEVDPNGPKPWLIPGPTPSRPPRPPARKPRRVAPRFPVLLAGAGAGLVIVALLFLLRPKAPPAQAPAPIAVAASAASTAAASPRLRVIPVENVLQESPALADAGPRATEDILTAHGDDCLPCAERSGCLDPEQEGSPCEAASDAPSACGGGLTERDVCLRTLAKIFTSNCAAVLQETPCLCGTIDTQACLEGTAVPNGPLYDDYACDFKARDTASIIANFRSSTFGAGLANSLVQCVAQSDCKCFEK